MNVDTFLHVLILRFNTFRNVLRCTILVKMISTMLKEAYSKGHFESL